VVLGELELEAAAAREAALHFASEAVELALLVVLGLRCLSALVRLALTLAAAEGGCEPFLPPEATARLFHSLLLPPARLRSLAFPGLDRFWAALRDVFPKTREQRCWVHKIANVLDKLPKNQQPKAKSSLHAMMNAATKAECERLIATFATDYEAKYPKAVKSLQTEADKLTTHFDFPAEHWKHLRTTNPIESTFATVKLRQRVTKGAGSRKAGLAMAYRLLLLAEASWRRLNGHQLLPLVRAGVQFVDGVRIERDDVAVKTSTTKTPRKTKTHPEEVAA
jgi:hypothetical protein